MAKKGKKRLNYNKVHKNKNKPSRLKYEGSKPYSQILQNIDINKTLLHELELYLLDIKEKQYVPTLYTDIKTNEQLIKIPAYKLGGIKASICGENRIKETIMKPDSIERVGEKGLSIGYKVDEAAMKQAIEDGFKTINKNK